MQARPFILLLLLSWTFPALSATAGSQQDGLEQRERKLELPRYQLLARVQADQHNHLASFTTDGCSGGLSEGWRFLARAIPAFKQIFGNRPPYESCCVVHDRAYWRGETEQGFDKRQQADAALQQCVIDFGKTHKTQFAHQFHLSPAIIEHNFHIIAGLMYRAVRVGGMPCTGLPWRWGYGWPQCAEKEK